MRHVRAIAILGMLLVPSSAWGQTNLSPAAMLKEAEHQVQVLGDADAAQTYYQRVADHAEATTEEKARAHLGMTLILVDRGRTDEARAHADWLAANAPRSQEAVTAKAKLAHLAARDPAALMPAETLVYMELVQPGRQLEQILEMLQEAGLDESLESMMNNMQGANTRPGGAAGPSPLGMILNPSLLGELKKIEGLAFGVSKLDDPATATDDPEFIGVLLPGQSQAVRGMVQMLLTMGSESVEPIGNSTLHKLKPNGKDAVFAAITPDAILVGRPRARVTETIARLNRGQAPSSLADQKRFQRQAGARRQDSVILMYVDVHQIWSQVKAITGAGEMHQLALLNELADIEAVDDLSLRSRLIDDGVAFEMAVSFKPDRPNRLYQLIHTPPADRKLLNYVPAHAMGCVLMSLDDGGARYDALMTFAEKAVRIGRQAEPGKEHKDPTAAVAELEAMLGINLRDDLFANIESIAAAVTAPGDDLMRMAAAGDDPDSAYALSSLLAIRVHSPDQFEQTLATFVNAVARHHLNDPQAEAAIVTDKIGEVPVTRYSITGAPLTPMVARFEDVFVITLHEPLTREIVEMVRGGRSDSGDRSDTGGRAGSALLRDPLTIQTLAKIPDQASKLLLIRPEVVLNATQKMERLKRGDPELTATSVPPMIPVHPMAGFTLENGESMTLRLEVRNAADLLAHIMKLHKANHRRHAVEVEATPAHSP